MSLPKPTIVIFDMDGTTVRHLSPYMLGLMEWLDDSAFKISRLWGWVFERGAQGPIILPTPEEPVKTPKSIIVHKAIHKLRRKDVDLLVEPCPHIRSVLRLLKNNNIPMALVSNGLGKGYGLDIIDKFDLDEFFPVTIFREDIRKSKPNPEPILLALQNMDHELTADDIIWYIGDRHKDVLAVINAREHLPCKIIPVAYALNAAAAILEKGFSPDHIIMSYQDMYQLLSKLLNSGAAAHTQKPATLNESAKLPEQVRKP